MIEMLYHIRQHGEISLYDLYVLLFRKQGYMDTSEGVRIATYLANLQRSGFLKLKTEGALCTVAAPSRFSDADFSDETVRIDIGTSYLVHALQRHLDGDGSSACRYDPHTTYVSVTKQFERIRGMLGFSVTDQYHYLQEKTQRERIFGRCDRHLRAKVFVITPFADKLLPVFEDHIKPVCDELGYSCIRGDLIDRQSVIMNDVWSLINNADIVICDCTGRNPNVFYELGIAHAVGKRVICITQYDEDIPFDIRQIRYLKYQYSPRGMKEFELSLKRTLSETI